MNLKILALFLIIGSSVGAAYQIRKQGRLKHEYYKSLLEFIEHIRNQISVFCAPIDRIISDYENSILEESGFLTLLLEGDWRVALEKNKYSRFIDRNSFELLCGFGKKLGRTGLEEQVAICDYTIGQLRKEYDKLINEAPGKTKAYASLCVVGGFMLAVLFI